MEQQLETAMTSLFGHRDVIGVLVVDSHGLCLASQGECQAKADGYIRSLVTRSKQLGAGAPVICVETEATKILVTENGDLTVAVYSATAH